jgi:hypothetical protein
MIAALILCAAGAAPVPAEAWTETFTIESMTLDAAPIDLATMELTGSPTRLCIPDLETRNIANWLRDRDIGDCQITAERVQKDRLSLEAVCSVGLKAEKRKLIAVKIGRHRYFGTYFETGRDDAGRIYEMTGRINAHRTGRCEP